MAENNVAATENPLGTKPLGRLLFSLAVPTAIANVVNAMYNIVDQIFIGQGVGTLGNAATSVAFPLTTICLAIGLMLGLGAASGFNLELGQAHASASKPHMRKAHEDRAREIVGAATGAMVVLGLFILLLVRMFLPGMLKAFGATETIMPYAMEYAGITSWGIPFLIFMMGVNPIVRADRSPRYSMAAVIIGAVINTVLDPLFIFSFGWGIAGAAWATVISQIISAVILGAYFPRFQSVRFTWKDFIPHQSEEDAEDGGSGEDPADDSFMSALKEYVKTVLYACRLGINSLIFQMSTVLVQITLNNMLRIYGAQTVYGPDIPIAVCGIVVKINVIFISLMIGLISGAQPICSYNYGAGRYTRVRGTVKLFTVWAIIIGTFSWLIFELFPDRIILLFGNGGGSELYFEYAERFMRTFLFFTFINGLQVCSATFFPSIGKPLRGALISFSKQILIFIPVLLALSRLYGLDGIMYAQPVTDVLAAALAIAFLIYEMRVMPREDA